MKALLAAASAILIPGLLAELLGRDPPPPVAPVPEEPSRSLTEEAAVLERGRLSARQRALARLGVHPDAGASELLAAQFERYRKDELPPALWLDLFEAAAQRGDARLQSLLAEREAALARSNDPLARFRECLQGGHAEAGRAIFVTKPAAGCVRCHAVDGQGGAIGPDLTWLRHSVDRLRILESIILPDSTHAPGFQPAVIRLKSGEEIGGVITWEGREEVTITSLADGKKRLLKTADFLERIPAVSPMPPAFGVVLSKREIRDLIEFLAEGD